ncbi:MAG TPA: 16S rRNA (cytosine(967)-C(5))-methyltransferase RsmB [Syntrophales bacterium]|nr:16S rRNA (cytosine(967)-C(5))-methyltransferase RsmB [Syntrophales bacterium]HOL58377.1 16S rRNA (cytosine(967)-C(5))-methyltransferase RsmB [Syntrophales bacterium]HPO34546.1 16S rRNA (cytosine(967)-C(5))-methyltransferase RsmB [Syntrophales bacterium]
MASSVRAVATSILSEVEKQGAFAEELLDFQLKAGVIQDERDRRLLTELTYGTLRMRGTCDYILKHHLRGWSGLPVTTQNILRLAVYQLLFTDRIPPYAVVNEAVDLTKKLAPAQAKLVNAVLRKILSRRREDWLPEETTYNLTFISARYSHPPWLVNRWVKRWGWDEALKLCKANNSTPPVTLRVNTLKATREEAKARLLREGFSVSATPLSPDGLIVAGPTGRLRESQAFEEGWVLYQDEASQLVSYLVSPAPGEELLDLCAGQGGKTFHLAALMKNEGKILATDNQAEKLNRLLKEAAKFGVSIVEVKPIDTTGPPSGDLRDRFDRILVDAPCSGTGTLRRAPEIKWRLQAKDLAHFARIQGRMLNFAARCVKKGGFIIYSTCSLMAEENEEVIASFLKQNDNFHFVPPSDALVKVVGQDGLFRTFPHLHGTDGFFGAKMVKD